jgi:hypothetical protein
MPTRKALSDVLARLTASNDDVDQAKELVLARGRAWTEPQTHFGLFETQIDGLFRIGPTPVAAIDDWMSQARDVVMGPRCLDQQV